MASISPPSMSKWVMMLMLILLVNFCNKTYSSYLGFSEYFDAQYSYGGFGQSVYSTMDGNFIYQYLWSWIVNNDFSFRVRTLDWSTSNMSILTTIVGIMVHVIVTMIPHYQGYLTLFAYMAFLDHGFNQDFMHRLISIYNQQYISGLRYPIWWY